MFVVWHHTYILRDVCKECSEIVIKTTREADEDIHKFSKFDSVRAPLGTVRHKILTGENIDEFDEFPAIRQYFPYQNFLFS